MSKVAENVIGIAYLLLSVVIMVCAYIASVVFNKCEFCSDCNEKVQELLEKNKE